LEVKMKKYVVLVGGVATAGLAAVIALGGGCASTSCEDTLTCPGMQGDGSTDGMGADHQLTDVRNDGKSNGDSGDGGMPTDGSTDADVFTPCSDASPPSMNGCVTNTSGLFVSSTLGSDAGTTTGTMTDPFATITEALAKATAGSNIYVCEGSYRDQITVSMGVNIYGGFKCPAGVWSYSGTMGSRGLVVGTTAAFTIQINAGSSAVDIEDLGFKAPDAPATANGQSSIAVFVNASTNVAFRRVAMQSGLGATGALGASGNNWTAASAPIGGNATGSTGGTAPTCSCGSTGGAGGTGTDTGGSPGGNGGPTVSGGTGGDGAGGLYGTPIAASCNNGINGATAPGQGGGTGQDAGGALTSSGWSGGIGATGTAGGVAQGGGGGSGGLTAVSSAGGGSAGGCGGCGGGPGIGGGAGGSSFALMSVASTVELDGCTLKAGNGGTGGTGGNGQAGQPGGLAGTQSNPGCVGGTGGTGGQAGGGGGGAGGYSLAIAYTMTEPTMKNGTTAMFGSGGGAGPAGTGGVPPATPGSVGIAQAALGF
jgi:hypothetical protein